MSSIWWPGKPRLSHTIRPCRPWVRHHKTALSGALRGNVYALPTTFGAPFKARSGQSGPIGAYTQHAPSPMHQDQHNLQLPSLTSSHCPLTMLLLPSRLCIISTTVSRGRRRGGVAGGGEHAGPVQCGVLEARLDLTRLALAACVQTTRHTGQRGSTRCLLVHAGRAGGGRLGRPDASTRTGSTPATPSKTLA